MKMTQFSSGQFRSSVVLYCNAMCIPVSNDQYHSRPPDEIPLPT